MVPVFCVIGMIASASVGGEEGLGFFIYLLIGAIFSTVALIMFKKGKISKNTMESSTGMGCAYLILCWVAVWPAIFISFVVAMPMAYGQLQREQLETQRQQQIEQLEAEKAEIIAMIDEALEEKR